MRRIACLVMLGLLASASTAHADTTPPLQAQGVLKTAAGTPIGNVLFTEAPDGRVFVSAAVKNLPAGEHGVTIREQGACTPAFDAAGDDLSIDLPSISVNAAGRGELEAVTTEVTVNSGSDALLDDDGSAVIVTAFGDEDSKAACAVLLPVPVPDRLPEDGNSLTGEFETVDGAAAGTVTLTETKDGTVQVQAEVNGLPAGEHAIHVHQFGQCTPTFGAAGEHYNPDNTSHGLEDPKGPHAGDLPNLTVDADGTGTLDTTSDLFTITPSDTTIRDTDGSAVIIHALPDDGVSDPGGAANGRIACAIVQPVVVPLPSTGGESQSWLLLSLAAMTALAGSAVRRSARR